MTAQQLTPTSLQRQIITEGIINQNHFLCFRFVKLLTANLEDKQDQNPNRHKINKLQ